MQRPAPSSGLSEPPAEASPRPGGAPLGRRRPRRRPALLRIGGRIHPLVFVLISVSVFALLLGLWALWTSQGWVDSIFLPSPRAVWDRLSELSSSGDLWHDIGVSVYRIMVGFAVAAAMAIPLGVLAGTYRLWDAVLVPLTEFIRYMPVVAFVPLTILWVGIDDTQKFVLIWIAVFFQMVLMIVDNVKRVPLDLVDIGRTLGMSDRAILARIVVPSAAPAIWDSMRINLGWAWTWVVLAELVAASSGLGYRITTAQRFFETDTIIGYVLVLGVLGLITDQTMKGIGRLMFRWAETRK
jgi:NitT/TauT family transport system permease protein